jgi:hypothetical protein
VFFFFFLSISCFLLKQIEKACLTIKGLKLLFSLPFQICLVHSRTDLKKTWTSSNIKKIKKRNLPNLTKYSEETIDLFLIFFFKTTFILIYLKKN